jgi:hypothetical protein
MLCAVFFGGPAAATCARRTAARGGGGGGGGDGDEWLENGTPPDEPDLDLHFLERCRAEDVAAAAGGEVGS